MSGPDPRQLGERYGFEVGIAFTAIARSNRVEVLRMMHSTRKLAAIRLSDRSAITARRG